jgi:hypothetical protein
MFLNILKDRIGEISSTNLSINKDVVFHLSQIIITKGEICETSQVVINQYLDELKATHDISDKIQHFKSLIQGVFNN